MINEKKLITMKELERISGFSRTTINYYIREELLPKPYKTARNMAYYDERFIEDLSFIKKLKEQHNLSLSEIKAAFYKREKGLDVDLMLSVRDRMFEDICSSSQISSMTWEELKRKSLLDEKYLKILKEQGLLFKVVGKDFKETNFYRGDNLVICKLFKQMIDQGIPLEEILPVGEKLEEVAKIGVLADLKYVFSSLFVKKENNVETDKVVSIIKNTMSSYQSLISLLHLNIMNRCIWNEKAHREEMEDFFRKNKISMEQNFAENNDRQNSD